MPKYPKGHTDISYYPHIRPKGKKIRKVAGSTTATNDFLVIIHKEYPDLTISQIRDLLLDKTKYIYNPEAIAVLDAYIGIGEGDVIPGWM